jgi:neutral trehalase
MGQKKKVHRFPPENLNSSSLFVAPESRFAGRDCQFFHSFMYCASASKLMADTCHRKFKTYLLGTRSISFYILLAGVSFWAPRAYAQTLHQRVAVQALYQTVPGQAGPRSAEYDALQKRLETGWNTWDVHSVMAQVLLPAGLTIRVGAYHSTTLYGDAFLPDALIGRQGANEEQVFPGPHAWDGSYTDLRLTWRGMDLRIQSAHAGGDLVILVTPLSGEKRGSIPGTIVFSAAYLWNRPGTVTREADRIEARGPWGTVDIFCVGAKAPYSNIAVAGPYLSAEFTDPVGISTGKRRTLREIQKVVEEQRQAYERSLGAPPSAAVDAIETTLGWDTIYEPERDRVISPVSRNWSVGWGGYVLFDWDTFFAATLAGIADRDLAYANAVETLRELTPAGFVPNYARAGGWKSFDRSEPPVGAISVLGLYKKFHDRWFLQETFAPLLSWNRWWQKHRSVGSYLVWGSDGENQPENPDDRDRGTRQGAILESGLDNSPMYDAAAFDEKTHKLQMADVGLMSLYVADCDALAEIAAVLNESAAAQELRERAKFYRASVASLWDEKSGMFLNKDLHTGELSPRVSPTNFYPLLARAATPPQAQRMIRDHLLNPQEFWGDWVIPATPRNDPAFKDQNYWRGRIWGPMNYLVYLGLRKYDQPQAREELARKSFELFQVEWSAKRHVHENYNAISGTGDDVSSSDRFYHWGALLALMAYMEANDKPAIGSR